VPVWVDDDRFDITRHVRHASLPRPGTADQLRQRCAEILERPLDRRRPLWEAWVVEGIAGGGFALLVKVHHCVALLSYVGRLAVCIAADFELGAFLREIIAGIDVRLAELAALAGIAVEADDVAPRARIAGCGAGRRR
jgi:diacylglycerol O-acyltransferase